MVLSESKPESRTLDTHDHSHPARANPIGVSRAAFREAGNSGASLSKDPPEWVRPGCPEDSRLLQILLTDRLSPVRTACNILPKPPNLLKLSAIAQMPGGRVPPTPGRGGGVLQRPALAPVQDSKCPGQGGARCGGNCPISLL